MNPSGSLKPTSQSLLVEVAKLIAAPARIYLVRHGEAEWFLSRQHTGRIDIGLTAHGEDEAMKLGKRLLNVRFSHVLMNPLQRARRTCELAGLTATVEVVPDLAEWDYGACDGAANARLTCH